MASSEHDPAARKRLAALMNDRRLELKPKLTWDEVAHLADIHRETLRAVRSGTGAIREMTKSGIEEALQWETGSIDAALGGGEPTPKPQPSNAEDTRGTSSEIADLDRAEQRAEDLAEQLADALAEVRRLRGDRDREAR